jgi:Kdo2-lipid IVA lauroyltransferase/acyltransferase
MSEREPFHLVHFLQNLVLRGLIQLALALPYRARLAFTGWLMRRVIGPFAGYRNRALTNLAATLPDLSLPERTRIADGALDNAGRTLIENYSHVEFARRRQTEALHGPGLDALEAARAAGRPAILVSGHFGNYEAVRAALVARGFDVGGLYRNMRNRYFNAHYVRTMEAFGGPVFPQGRAGTAGFVRHLKSGGLLVLLFDQHVPGGDEIPFLGRRAATAVSAAELALRYDALLIPFFATRQPDGLSFDLALDPPIPASDAVTMTRAMTAALEARVRVNPEQWFWIHDRWKVETRRTGKARKKARRLDG